MRTFKRICIRDYTVKDKVGNQASVFRGKEYITSEVNDAPKMGPEPVVDHVIVFSNFWFPVPVEHFAGEILHTNHSDL